MTFDKEYNTETVCDFIMNDEDMYKVFMLAVAQNRGDRNKQMQYVHLFFCAKLRHPIDKTGWAWFTEAGYERALSTIEEGMDSGEIECR